MTTIFGQISNSENTRPIQNLAERAPSPDEADRRMLDHHAQKMRVAMPAAVVSWDPTKQTITAQPLIREKIIDRATGSIQWVTLPNLLDVPVQFPQGGDFILTMPVRPGDEVLVVFNDMCIDSWWASGGIQNWNDRRRHDLSDAVAILGVNSVPHVVQNIASNATELRSKDGQVKVSVKSDEVFMTPDGGTTSISAKAANVTITATTINLNGVLKHNGYNYVNHIHSNAAGPTGGVTELP